MIAGLPDVGIRVKQAMQELDRGDFVPRFVDDQSRQFIYQDRVISMGNETSSISMPSLVALMTELLSPQPGQRILELGTASGYQAAVLEALVGPSGEVHTVEYDDHLAKTAGQRLKLLGHRRIFTHHGDGLMGDPEHGPFHGIVATAAAKEIPPVLTDQLTEGGRIIIPVGPDPYHLKLTAGRKLDGKLETLDLLDVNFVPFRGGSKGAFSDEYLEMVFRLKLLQLDEEAQSRGMDPVELLVEKSVQNRAHPSDVINYSRLPDDWYKAIDEGRVEIR